MGTQAEIGRGRPVGAHRFAVRDTPRGTSAVHEFSALAFVLGGTAEVEQGERYRVESGDVFLVPAGSKHRMRTADSLEAWGVQFCPPCFATTDLVSLYAPFDRARAGASTVVPIPSDRHSYLATLCAELSSETGRHTAGPHEALAQTSLLTLILAEVARAAQRVQASDIPGSLVGDALRFVERHCLGPLTIADVAASVHRTPAYVSTAVRRSTGKSIKAWIIAGRLAEACNRLLHTDEMVEIIAERVGYRDPTHFIRLFRRSYGATPTSWRMQARRSLG